MVITVIVLMWHTGVFGFWMWLRANLDTDDIVNHDGRVSKFSGLVDTVTVEWEKDGVVHIR